MTVSNENIRALKTEELIARHECDRLGEYLSLLAKENKRHNLVSRETSPAEHRRLAAESLVVLESIDAVNIASYLDIGSGGGLPAFPLLLCRSFGSGGPDRPVLMDRSNKKTAALRRIAIALGMKIDLEVVEFEKYHAERSFDLITARLVRITPTILNMAVSLLNPSGTIAVYSDCALVPADNTISRVCFSYTIDSEVAPRCLTLYTQNL